MKQNWSCQEMIALISFYSEENTQIEINWLMQGQARAESSENSHLALCHRECRANLFDLELGKPCAQSESFSSTPSERLMRFWCAAFCCCTCEQRAQQNSLIVPQVYEEKLQGRCFSRHWDRIAPSHSIPTLNFITPIICVYSVVLFLSSLYLGLLNIYICTHPECRLALRPARSRAFRRCSRRRWSRPRSPLSWCGTQNLESNMIRSVYDQ